MKRFSIVSLGCPKNLVDSEYICERFQQEGFVLTEDPAHAELVVVNTCSFLASAVEESINTMLELIQDGKEVVCAGCLVSRYRQELLRELPEIRFFAAPGSYAEIAEAYLRGESYLAPVFGSVVSRSFFTGRSSAYLKLSEGCSNHCNYCLIPAIRGELVSKPFDEVIRESTRLADSGAKELILVAQDLGSYGKDRPGERSLVELVERISRIEAVEWIRLMYVHPASLTGTLVELMKTNPKVCPYIDLPIQHVSEKVLQAMGRKGGAQAVKAAFDLLAPAAGEIWIRSTVMVGHPGEDDDAFLELEQFIQEGLIGHLGVFTYSAETGTRSSLMPDAPKRRVALKRKNRIMAIQQGVSKKRLHKMKGERVKVLIEGYHPETELLLKGRASFQAPEVDGEVIITEGGADAGTITDVEITGSHAYDLIGKIL
ncbi:MAG: 30S ribosomal protein S12 methylthiotransferase RimO [Syntrophaceae bacterium]